MARTIAKDYDEKRQQILECAARGFADEGFDRTSVSSIALACNISKANVYHYYKSKDDILFDILDGYLSGLRSRICGMSLAGDSAEAQLESTIIEILIAYQGADNEHRLQTESLKHLPKEQQKILVDHQRTLIHHVSALIEAISPDVFAGDKEKLRSTTMSLFGMLNWFYMWNANAGKHKRERYARLVSQLCLRGIPGL